MIRHNGQPRPAPLLRPVGLGDLQLPNRVVMAPLTRARATNHERAPTELHAAYYAQRASAGLIVSESVWVSERAVGFSNVPGLYSDEQVVAWRGVTDVVHALGGRIVAQLWHAGANSHPDHLGGRVPLGPSAVNPDETSYTRTGPKPTVTPEAMTGADIRCAVSDYRTAAEQARRAGFDGVEIAAGGTYLIAQFLNPRLNRRTDAYGVRRCRLALEVFDEVTAVWGAGRVGVRLSPFWSSRDRPVADQRREGYPYVVDERALAGYDELVAELDARRLGFLHLRGPAPSGAPDLGAFARYRALFSGSLIANHGFDRDSATAVIESGVADAVSFARPFIANPDLVTRFALDQALATSDPATHYTGGREGLVTYPIYAAS